MTKPDTCIQTYTGKEFDYNDLDSMELEIDDFVFPLSHICRYGGHSQQFYSVAQHLMLVYTLMKVESESHNLKFHGLIHDFGEAFFCDLPRPMKYSLPPDILKYYERQEAKVVDYARRMYGEEPLDADGYARLKYYDTWALAIESKRVLRRPFRNFDYSQFPEPDVNVDTFFRHDPSHWALLLKIKVEGYL